MGGTFYSKGDYQWNGTFWDSAVDEIAAQLEEDRNDIQSLQTTVFNHVTDLNNPHETEFGNLEDVQFTGLANGDIPVYNSGLGKWENKPQTSGVNFAQVWAINTLMSCK